ncbi:MAG: A/G-specific adenine glycosylase [Deinococcota bacterium]
MSTDPLLTDLSHNLLTWFDREQRELPWRSLRTPYRVWISEVMLQQTQVATVIPYFERWQRAFPDVYTLAAAPLDDVLKLWEGLGYYRRARLIHACAKVICEEHAGTLPNSYDQLITLPGIGPYTAAAIASLAFGEAAIAVDGNIKRVAARLFELAGGPDPKLVTQHLQPHLPAERAGAFNEALMELGATVCTPKTPACARCPVQGQCLGHQHNTVQQFPEPKPKKHVPTKVRYAWLVPRDNELLLSKRRGDGKTKTMLKGLWGFPLTETQPEGTILESVKHAYTHFKIRVHPVIVTSSFLLDNEGLDLSDSRYVPLTEIDTLALSKLDHKILARYQDCQLHSDKASETYLFDVHS